MLRDERTERGVWGRAAVVGLCLAWGLALPAQGQDEPAVEETSPIEVTVVPDPNDQIVILSNGIPLTELRIRPQGVRTHETLHPVGEWTDPASIPTRGLGSQAVDTATPTPAQVGTTPVVPSARQVTATSRSTLAVPKARQSARTATRVPRFGKSASATRSAMASSPAARRPATRHRTAPRRSTERRVHQFFTLPGAGSPRL